MVPIALLLVALAADPEDREAPSVVHTPVREAQKGQEVRFEVEIVDRSGVFEPIVSWRIAGDSSWRSINLYPAGGDQFVASLPAAAVLADLEYFIEAYDKVGNGPVRFGNPDKPLRIAVRAAASPAPPPVAAAPPPAPAPAEGGSALGPWLTMGGGAALLATGAVIWIGATYDASDLADRYPKGVSLKPEDQVKAVSVVNRGRVGSGLMIAGLVAGAGGAAWLAVRPDAVALAVGWGF